MNDGFNRTHKMRLEWMYGFCVLHRNEHADMAANYTDRIMGDAIIHPDREIDCVRGTPGSQKLLRFKNIEMRQGFDMRHSRCIEGDNGMPVQNPMIWHSPPPREWPVREILEPG